MTKSPLIITLAIIMLFGIVITVLNLIIPDTEELSKGVIVNKYTKTRTDNKPSSNCWRSTYLEW